MSIAFIFMVYTVVFAVSYDSFDLIRTWRNVFRYVMEYGTAQGCPEKKNYCASQPCKNGGKCLDGWGTYRCQCPDGYGNKDCSEGKSL